MSDAPTGRRRRDDIITVSDTPNLRKPMYSYEELWGCVKGELYIGGDPPHVKDIREHHIVLFIAH